MPPNPLLLALVTALAESAAEREPSYYRQGDPDQPKPKVISGGLSVRQRNRAGNACA